MVAIRPTFPAQAVSIATPVLTATIVVGLALASFLLLGPANIRGPAVFMVTSGNSMEPTLHQGDLVVARAGQPAAVGDIMAYRSSRTGQQVLHRVIGRSEDRFILKGDNNSWIDSSQPTDADLIGKFWFHVPKAGKVLDWLRSPLHAAALAGGMVAMTAYQGMKPVQRKLPRGMSRKWTTGTWAGLLHQAASSMGQTLLGLLLGLVVLSIGAAAITWRLPAHSQVDAPQAFRHRGVFGYSAATVLPRAAVAPLPGAVEGSSNLATLAQDPIVAALLLVPVSTGQPIFVNVNPKVTFTFHYVLQAPAAASVSGTARMDVVLSDITGWTRRFPFAPEQAFTGNVVDIAVTDADLAPLMVAFPIFEAITGHAPRYYLASVVAVVDTAVVLDGQEVHAQFEPALPFRVVPPNEIFVETENTKQFESKGVPVATVVSDDAFSFELTGAIPGSLTELSSVSLLGKDVSVRALRVLSATTVTLALLGVVAVMVMQRLARRRGEVFMINAQHGQHLVLVDTDDATSSTSRIQVASMEDLLRLAHYHNAPILVQVEAERYRYIVRDGERVYAHDALLP